LAEAHIEKLILRVPGGRHRDGRRLAEQVGAALAALQGMPGSCALPSLRVRVTEDPAASDEMLARSIAAQILQALAPNLR
jgi:hypothetical protein